MPKKEIQEINELLNYLKSPSKIIFNNLLAGIFRGVGTMIGVTLIFALLIYVLNFFVDFPLIGEYFESLKNILENQPQV